MRWYRGSHDIINVETNLGKVLREGITKEGKKKRLLISERASQPHEELRAACSR